MKTPSRARVILGLSLLGLAIGSCIDPRTSPLEPGADEYDDYPFFPKTASGWIWLERHRDLSDGLEWGSVWPQFDIKKGSGYVTDVFSQAAYLQAETCTGYVLV